jgi:hypothetical protein
VEVNVFIPTIIIINTVGPKSISTNKCTRIIGKYKNIFTTPTYVSVNRVSSSGGLYQRATSVVAVARGGAVG